MLTRNPFHTKNKHPKGGVLIGGGFRGLFQLLAVFAFIATFTELVALLFLPS